MQCKFKKEKKKKPNKKIVYKNLHTVGCSYSLENRKKTRITNKSIAEHVKPTNTIHIYDLLLQMAINR